MIFERLDVNLTQASRFQRLGRAEIKSVAKSVLEALQFIHANDYIYGALHTDLHPATICVNNNPTGGAPRFTAVKLIGFACSIPVGSVMAQKATYKALPLAASPESHLGLHLGTSTDIWSFGNLIISLLHGDDYSIFAPRPSDTEANRAAKLDDPYPILRRMYDCFGHFPERLLNALDTKAKNEIHKIYDMGRPATPFKRVPPTEIPTADRIFIQKIMKLDPAERPTAEELLADEWFDEVSEDTRRSKSRSSSPEWEELPVCPTPRRMCHFL
ncbi:CTD kinase subunit alpha [Naviculisporaceae sp. PSN 640]